MAAFIKTCREFSEKRKSWGVNFWGFAGFAETEGDNESSGKWQEGDDLTAVPPQEPQGLNSVFV